MNDTCYHRYSSVRLLARSSGLERWRPIRGNWA